MIIKKATRRGFYVLFQIFINVTQASEIKLI